MLDLQHQYNNCTTIPHMMVGLTYWGPPSCEELLYSCCISVVQESNPLVKYEGSNASGPLVFTHGVIDTEEDVKALREKMDHLENSIQVRTSILLIKGFQTKSLFPIR
jgi:hypothetical protein